MIVSQIRSIQQKNDNCIHGLLKCIGNSEAEQSVIVAIVQASRTQKYTTEYDSVGGRYKTVIFI